MYWSCLGMNSCKVCALELSMCGLKLWYCPNSGQLTSIFSYGAMQY